MPILSINQQPMSFLAKPKKKPFKTGGGQLQGRQVAMSEEGEGSEAAEVAAATEAFIALAEGVKEVIAQFVEKSPRDRALESAGDELIHSLHSSTSPSKEKFSEANKEWFAAIENCDVIAMRRLIDAGAVNSRLTYPSQASAMTALHVAINTQNSEVVSLVIEAGYKNNPPMSVVNERFPHQDIYANSALVEINGNKQIVPCGGASIFWSSDPVILELLLQNGADPNSYDDPFALVTVLMQAKDNFSAIVSLFKDYGADLNAKDEQGKSILEVIRELPSYALSEDHKRACEEALLQFGST